MKILRSIARGLGLSVGRTAEADSARAEVPAVQTPSQFIDGFDDFSPAVEEAPRARQADPYVSSFTPAAQRGDGFESRARSAPVDLSGGVKVHYTLVEESSAATSPPLEDFSASLDDLDLSMLPEPVPEGDAFSLAALALLGPDAEPLLAESATSPAASLVEVAPAAAALPEVESATPASLAPSAEPLPQVESTTSALALAAEPVITAPLAEVVPLAPADESAPATSLAPAEVVPMGDTSTADLMAEVASLAPQLEPSSESASASVALPTPPPVLSGALPQVENSLAEPSTPAAESVISAPLAEVTSQAPAASLGRPMADTATASLIAEVALLGAEIERPAASLGDVALTTPQSVLSSETASGEVALPSPQPGRGLLSASPGEAALLAYQPEPLRRPSVAAVPADSGFIASFDDLSLETAPPEREAQAPGFLASLEDLAAPELAPHPDPLPASQGEGES